MADRFEALAADELAGRPISTEDSDWLLAIGYELGSLWRASGEAKSARRSEGEKDSALIADIMRGLDPVANIDEVLEIGTGYFDRIYVVVPDDQGGFQVASGGVYSYYEFPWPTSDRLNDQQWRQMLRDDAAPERPAWQAPLFPPRATAPEGAPEPTPKPKRWRIESELGSYVEGAYWEPYRRSPAGAAFDPFEAGALTGVIFDATERDLHKSVDYVVLFRFPGAAELDRYWERRAQATTVAPEREDACFDDRAGTGTWPNGEYLCYVSGSGTALLRWTDERTNTYGVMNAVSGRKHLDVLARQWASIRSR